MTIKHSVLTGASLHEPKGVAAAAAGQTYVADGTGGGAQKTIATDANATITTMEPKGIAAASEFEIYHADGSSGGSWASPGEIVERTYGYIAVTSSGQTFVIGAGEVDTDIPFSLTYESIIVSSNLSFNATTNVITFSGAQTVIVHIVTQMSHALTTGVNATLKILLQKSTNGGSTWVTQDQSLTVRKFPGADAGNMTLNSLLSLATNDQIRFIRNCDTASTFTVTNINMSLIGAA